MVMVGKQQFAVLYLEGWQIRMIKDVLGVECEYWTVPVGGPGGGGYKYIPPPHSDPRAKKMYLTEWQVRQVLAETGQHCEYVELAPGVITKYGVPPAVMAAKMKAAKK